MSNIYIYDEFSPEDNAMLQALYSRSPLSVTEHVEKVRSAGSGKFMEKFYVGYGHASIADCGSTTIFIEKLSILADKAIQDWPLYSGQETSTRYVDMSKQPIIDPLNSPLSKGIMNNWMVFYINGQKELQDFLKKKYPRQENEDEKIYDKAIAARSFDIMRSFLPAGITTQLSWHTNLRQAWDKLCILKHNPLPEVRDIANEILHQLKERYPHSFSFDKNQDQEKYWEEMATDYNFFNPKIDLEFSYENQISNDELEKYENAILKRSPKTCLPLFLGELGLIRFDFLLDYGSFRDIQRHRNGVCRMPLLTVDFGFEQWYLNELPENLKAEAQNLIKSQIAKIKELNTDDVMRQYYIAMGFRVPCRVSYRLPAAIYVAELRSNKPVHPTLRKIAHKMHYALQNEFPKLKLYSDLEPDKWDINRGKHDIIQK